MSHETVKRHVARMLILAVAGLAVASFGGTIAEQAKSEGKGMMVFAYGSDWSVAGRALYGVFSSEAFQSAVSNSYVTGSIDIRDNPTPESKAANEWAEPGDLESTKLPALFLTAGDGRGFFAWENIPIDATAETLLSRIAEAERVRDRAEKLIAQAEGKDATEAAELLGRALETVEPQLGSVGRLLGKKCCGGIFERVKKLDPDDKTGWQRRYTMESGIALIASVNKMRERKAFGKGEEIIAREAAKSDRHLTVNQRQALAMLPYALYRTEKPREKDMVKLLDEIAAMDPTTLWGTAAVGFLIRHKAPEADKYAQPKPDWSKVMRPRVPAEGKPAFSYDAVLAADLAALGGVVHSADLANLSAERQTALVRAHILLAAGKDAVERMQTQEGGDIFLRTFFSDRDWMEAFAGSGPWHCGAAGALANLEMMAWNEPGVFTNDFQRKAATAFSMNFSVGTNNTFRACSQDVIDRKTDGRLQTPPNDVAMVRTLQIFTELSNAGRLHDKVYGLDVYEWRYLLFPWDRNNPEDLLALNAFCNTSYEKTFKMCWRVPYRKYNCFGDNVHKPLYYQPWMHRQTRFVTSPEIGGVCNMISSFAVTLGHAHGLMAVTAGQPHHCAFVVRPERGGPKRWNIRYYIGQYTQGRWSVFNFGGYQSILAAEDLYEGTTLADREYARWLANIRRAQAGKDAPFSPEIADLYKAAMESAPGNWPAGRDWNGYLSASKAGLDAWRTYADTVLKTTSEWIPVVRNLMKPYLRTLSAPDKAKEMDAAVARMIGAVRLTGRKLQEKPDYSMLLDMLARRFGKKDTERLFRFYTLALKAHPGMDDFFMQTLSWGAKRYIGDQKMEMRFLDLVTQTLEDADRIPGDGDRKTKAEKIWSDLIVKAESDGAYERFRRLVELANRLYPQPPLPENAKPYPQEDFGGDLISPGSLVQYSARGKFDAPMRHPEFSDETPLRGWSSRPASAGRGDGGTWLQLRLGGISEVNGIVVVAAGSKKTRRTLLPFKVEISEDGRNWDTVATIKTNQSHWRIPVEGSSVRAKFVRLVRKDAESEEPFRFAKLLIYGRKLY